MVGAYFALGILGLLAVVLVGWVIAGEFRERRKARAAAEAVARFQRSCREQGG